MMSKIHKVQQDTIFENSSFVDSASIAYSGISMSATTDASASPTTQSTNNPDDISESFFHKAEQMAIQEYPKEDQNLNQSPYEQKDKSGDVSTYYNTETLQDGSAEISHNQNPNQQTDLSLDVEQVLVSYSNDYPVNNLEIDTSNEDLEQELDQEQFNKESDDPGSELESGKDNILQTFHNAVEVLNEGQNRTLNVNVGFGPQVQIQAQAPSILHHDFARSRLSQLSHDRLLSPKFNRSKNWCKEETFILLNGLIELTKDLEPQKREVMLRSNMIFDQISEKLLAKGYDRNTQACLVRWRNIIRIYKTQRRIVMEHGGEMKDHYYASEIEQIYGSGSNVLLFGDKDSNDEYNGRLSDSATANVDESLQGSSENAAESSPENLNPDLNSNSSSSLNPPNEGLPSTIHKPSMTPNSSLKTRGVFPKVRGLSKSAQKPSRVSQLRKSTPSLASSSQYSSHVTQSLLLPRPDSYSDKNKAFKNNATPIAPAPIHNPASMANVTPLTLLNAVQPMNNLSSMMTPMQAAMTSKSNPMNYLTSRPLDQTGLLDSTKWNPIATAVPTNPFVMPNMSMTTAPQNFNSSNNNNRPATTTTSISTTEKKRKRNAASAISADSFSASSEPLSRIESQVSKILIALNTQTELTQKLTSELEYVKITVETHKNQIAKLCEELEDKDMKRDQLQSQLMSTVQALSGVITNKPS